MTVLISISVGCLATAVAGTSEVLLRWKNDAVHRVIHSTAPRPLLRAWAFHMAWSSTLALAGSLLVSV